MGGWGGMVGREDGSAPLAPAWRRCSTGAAASDAAIPRTVHCSVLCTVHCAVLCTVHCVYTVFGLCTVPVPGLFPALCSALCTAMCTVLFTGWFLAQHDITAAHGAVQCSASVKCGGGQCSTAVHYGLTGGWVQKMVVAQL